MKTLELKTSVEGHSLDAVVRRHREKANAEADKCARKIVQAAQDGRPTDRDNATRTRAYWEARAEALDALMAEMSTNDDTLCREAGQDTHDEH